MKHPGLRWAGLIGICLLAVLAFGSISCTTSEDQKTAIKGADYAEICNLMSLHSWYHAAIRNDLECEEIWVSPDGEFGKTAIWAQTSGYWMGMDKIKAKYGAKDPKGNMPDPKGGFVWHTITTPVVEIAEDRKTAKGIWYTPGIVGSYSADGKNNSQWMWEKYGVDFVRENGKWKVWHMKVYTDFATPIGEAIGSRGGPPGGGPNGAPGGAPGMAARGGAPGTSPEKQNPGETIGSELGPQGGGAPAPDWDYVYKDQYRGWGPDTTVTMRPRPPKPYKTWSETWSYTDEGE
ncbi:MAG: hypothetical protein H6Q04_2995 [Acidobacteria bacterium]|jgi:hypothetical protein|nr:hypothetical protein [Acidobacteriota bacterium]